MLDKINELPKLDERGVQGMDQEVTEIDLGADLWNAWDRVWNTQLKRGLKGVESRVRKSPPILPQKTVVTSLSPKPESKPVPKKREGTQMPIHPGRGKTKKGQSL